MRSPNAGDLFDVSIGNCFCSLSCGLYFDYAQQKRAYQTNLRILRLWLQAFSKSFLVMLLYAGFWLLKCVGSVG